MGIRTYFKEVASVLITVVDAELAAENADVDADAKVVGHEGGAGGLDDDLALEEETLGHARVGLLGLGDHDRLVLQVVVDDGFAHALVFEARLNHVLFKVAVESQDL